MAVAELVNAALDQPNPTPELQVALQGVLKLTRHPDRLLSSAEKKNKKGAKEG